MRWFTITTTVVCVLGCLGGKKDEGQLGDGCVDGVDNDGDGDFDCSDASCASSPDCGGDADTDADSDTDTDSGGSPVVSYEWDAEGLSISVDHMPGSGFELGIAETGATGEPWMGEDCFNGTAGWLYCHGFDGHTGYLEALLGSDKDPDNVVEGSTTLFDIDLAYRSAGVDRLTYMVTFDDGSCVVLGDDPSYYDAFGCTHQ